jgi:hypothetical protein
LVALVELVVADDGGPHAEAVQEVNSRFIVKQCRSGWRRADVVAAERTIEFFTCACTCLTCVDSYTVQPASTLVPSGKLTRPEESDGGSRLPWKSFSVIRRTSVVWSGR